MSGVSPLAPYTPVCCGPEQIDPFVDPYFEYVDQFDYARLRNL